MAKQIKELNLLPGPDCGEDVTIPSAIGTYHSAKTFGDCQELI
jgi:hypothetical protein